MNQEIETRIIESWDSIAQWAQKGGEFVAEQAPLVAWEIVTYGRAYHLASVVVCVAALSAYAIAIRLAWKACKRSADANNGTLDEDVAVPCIVGTVILGVVTIIPSMIGLEASVSPMLKAWFAPRLYVLEYVADLVGLLP